VPAIAGASGPSGRPAEQRLDDPGHAEVAAPRPARSVEEASRHEVCVLAGLVPDHHEAPVRRGGDFRHPLHAGRLLIDPDLAAGKVLRLEAGGGGEAECQCEKESRSI